MSVQYFFLTKKNCTCCKERILNYFITLDLQNIFGILCQVVTISGNLFPTGGPFFIWNALTEMEKTKLYTLALHVKPSLRRNFYHSALYGFWQLLHKKLGFKPSVDSWTGCSNFNQRQSNLSQTSKSLTSQGVCRGHLNQYFPMTFPCSMKISIFLCNWEVFSVELAFPIYFGPD